MDARVSRPPGLPRSEPTPSFWQDPPSALAHHRTTAELPGTADVVIIGGGITGTSIAYHLLAGPPTDAPLPAVVLLEARTACSGATGRNGGHTKTASYGSFLRNAETLGTAEAVCIVRYEYAVMRAVHDFARAHGIACDSWQGDTVDVIYNADEWARAQKAFTAMHEALEPDEPAGRHAFWNAKEAEEKFFAPGACGAITYEAGSISGYKFATGALELAVEEGLNLQTETPALSLRREGDAWAIETPRGVIRARQVVLATNGFTAHLLPRLQGVIVPLRGHMSAQRPGSGLPAGGLGRTYTFLDRHGYEYMIQRPPGTEAAGRIMIGGCTTKLPDGGVREFGTTDDTTYDMAVVRLLEQCTKEYFGACWGEDDPRGRLSHYWTGIMGFSGDGFPLVGPVPGETDLFVAAAFNGQGMVLCWLAGQALAHTLHGRRDEARSLLPSAFQITEDRMKLKFKGWLDSDDPKASASKEP